MADFAKKLTVSFGAFSCTLSGFDDPFPVMRQVVDYFQALSKSDPSFGAHPERPDTEALRALAEKTSGLSVGAEIQGDEVILRSVTDSFDQESGDARFAATSPEMPVEETITTPVPEENPDLTATDSPNETQIEDISTLVSAVMAEAQTDQNVNRIAATPPIEQPQIAHKDQKNQNDQNKADVFDQLQIDDLDDEAFGNVDADAIFDAVRAPEPAASQSENMSGYLSEAVQFTDIEDPEMDRLWEDRPEPSRDETSQDDRVDTPSQTGFDPVPLWENALTSDEPIEEIEENKIEGDDQIAASIGSDDEEPPLTYDDHIEAEQKALTHILAATKASDTLHASNPLVAFKEDTKAQNPRSNTPDDARNTAHSLVLGFGDAAGLDATGQISTGTLDTRPDRSTEALKAMGMVEDETDNFGWSTDDDAPVEHAKSAPLLLTPMQAVPSLEEDLEVISDPAPTPSIDLNQDDPRPDLRRFAAAAGAVSMTELLEASAAFSTLVSGRPSFSRGEVLDLFDEFSDEDGFTQEARIKTFGSLLRCGRIQSTGNGTYEMTMDALSDYEGARRVG